MPTPEASRQEKLGTRLAIALALLAVGLAILSIYSGTKVDCVPSGESWLWPASTYGAGAAAMLAMLTFRLGRHGGLLRVLATFLVGASVTLVLIFWGVLHVIGCSR